MKNTTAMLRADETRTVLVAVTVIFLVLGFALEGLLVFYWDAVLKDRLKTEALSQAEILAHSQSNLIARTLLTGSGEERQRNIQATLDELLLLRDSTTGTPFFESVELEVDDEALSAAKGSLNIRRGNPGTKGFQADIAIFNPDTFEVLGIAHFRVSDRFFQQLAGDLRKQLWLVSVTVVGVLVVVWIVLVLVLRRLHFQTLERHRAERELSQQEKKYERLLNSLSNYFIYGKDAQGHLTFVSDAVTKVFGFSGEQFKERFLKRLAPEGSAANSQSPERSFEVELQDENSITHHLELSEVRTVDEKGDLSGFEGIARDVTAQRQAQVELKIAKEQAETANQAKSQFLANMSHEIRTPLNAIVGMTALAMKNEVAPRIRDYLDKIRASATLLTEIIEDILDLSRIEAGRLEIQHVQFDLDELLADLADVVGVRAEQKNIEILFSKDEDVRRTLIGDPVRLKQILLNLLNNALKFTKTGEIIVTITRGDTRREGAEVRFCVRDTGIGIAPEHLSSVFEPFSQVDASMTRRFGGLGLGLAISRRLVEMMKGSLRVDSTPGEGSEFSFSAVFDVPQDISWQRRVADEFRDLPVLVADDNAHAREVLSSMLKSLSFHVVSVPSGEEALAEAVRAAKAGRPYRLALFDWKMPGIDGAVTATRLGESTELEVKPPVILVTAYDRHGSLRADEVGVQAVLHKPISPSTLHDAVLRVLNPAQNVYSYSARPPSQIRFVEGQAVLVVEDNAINRQVAREFLSAAGLEVTEAHNGYEALEQLERTSFDAVLMDVQMPELDGMETVRAVRMQSRWKDLPVIAMTAHAMLGDRERFLNGGMSDYIAKPIDEDALLLLLTRWLRVLDAAAPVRDVQEVKSAQDLPASLPGIEIQEALRRTSGNSKLFLRLVNDFRNENNDVMVRLKWFLEEGATEKALALLHTLKGSAATIGARRLADAAAKLETSLREGTDTKIASGGLRIALQEFRESADLLSGVPRKSEPGVATTPVRAEDAKAALPLIRTMNEYLKQNNLATMECFREIRNLIGSRFPNQLSDLEDCLDRLDFESARSLLPEIEAALTEYREEA